MNDTEFVIKMEVPCTTLSQEEVAELLGYKVNSLRGKELPPPIKGSNNRYFSWVVYQWMYEQSIETSQQKRPWREFSDFARVSSQKSPKKK